MCDHGTAPKVTSGIQREFDAAVLTQLHNLNLTDEEMQSYTHRDKKEELGRRLQRAFDPRYRYDSEAHRNHVCACDECKAYAHRFYGDLYMAQFQYR